MGGGLLEVVLAVVTLLVCMVVLWLTWIRTAQLGIILKTESEMQGENLNHIANALVGLSELLDSADDLIEEAQQIPTMGQMLQEMASSFLISKLSPSIQPFAEAAVPLISDNMIPHPYGETESSETDEETPKHSVQRESHTTEHSDPPDN